MLSNKILPWNWAYNKKFGGDIMQSMNSNTNVPGLDVSHHQGKIDWNKVARAGYKFALLKATQGLMMVDSELQNNYNGAKANNIKLGFYHYGTFTNESEAKAEAQHFIQIVKSLKSDLPYVLDLEDAKCKTLSTDALSKLAVLWLETVRGTLGDVMIYTGAYFARDELNKTLGKYPLWIAHYGVTKPLDNNTWSTWTIFQYSSTGSVPGIKGNVDLDVMEKSYFDQICGNILDNIKVVVNDKLVAYGRNIDGHIYLPLRTIGEALNKTVAWDNTSKIPYINGKEIKNFQVVEGITFVQVADVGTLLSAKVSWDNVNKKVYIYYK